MTLINHWEIYCDECNSMAQYYTGCLKPMAIKEAKEDGYIFSKGKVFCSQACKQKFITELKRQTTKR